MNGRLACIAWLALAAGCKTGTTAKGGEVLQPDEVAPQEAGAQAESAGESDPLGELTIVESYGIRFGLPSLEERMSDGDASAGGEVAMGMEGTSQMVGVGWGRGFMPSGPELQRALGMLPRGNELSLGPGRLRTTRSQLQQTETLVGSLEGIELSYAITSFQCPDDPRVFALVSAFALPEAEHVEQHERILQTIECGPVPDLPPVFPLYRGPHASQGYTDPAGVRGRIEGVAYVDIKQVEPSLGEQLRADPAARAADLREQGYVLEDEAAAVESLPSEDSDRMMWRVTLERREAMSAGEFELVFGTLVCRGDNFVFSLRPIDRRIDDAVEAARQLECI